MANITDFHLWATPLPLPRLSEDFKTTTLLGLSTLAPSYPFLPALYCSYLLLPVLTCSYLLLPALLLLPPLTRSYPLLPAPTRSYPLLPALTCSYPLLCDLQSSSQTDLFWHVLMHCCFDSCLLSKSHKTNMPFPLEWPLRLLFWGLSFHPFRT